jgi:membrane-associated phospholipid phosphatase
MHTITQQQKEEKIRKGVFRFFSLKVLVISGLFFGSLFVFAWIIHKAVYGNEQAFDNKIFSFFSRLSATPLLVRFMKLFTFFGSSTFLLPAYIVLILYLVSKKKFRYSLHIAVVAISSTALMFALKELTHRHRPDLPLIQGITNYSFPSGHALSSFIFCGIFVYVVWHQQLTPFYKWLYTSLLFCFAVTIGISRIILKVHYPTDVIASFCLGTEWAIMSLWIMKRISRKAQAKIEAGTETISTP